MAMKGKIKFVDPGTKDWGFITPDEGGQDVHFTMRDFIGEKPSVRDSGASVEFEIQEDLRGRHARSARLLEPAGGEFAPPPTVPRRDTALRAPRSNEFLLDWAYLGYLPAALKDLQGLALDERWEFRDTPTDPEKPLPILHTYLIYTFGRLTLEKKVVVNEARGLAAFNTGLVDPRYERIYALLQPNDDSRAPWQLTDFCIAGEGTAGQNLVRYFNPLPSPPHYFEEPADLLYDVRAGKPELDWRHVIIERIDRYPMEFIGDHRPQGFAYRVPAEIPAEERKRYFLGLGDAIERDARTYRTIMNRVKDAVDLSLKRVSWNFKTAVPQYYPLVRRLQLLLPLCLVSDDRVDLALAVEKTPSGSYLGHTVLPLDWAYKNARLICRPDSDWLEPESIAGGVEEEEEGRATP